MPYNDIVSANNIKNIKGTRHVLGLLEKIIVAFIFSSDYIVEPQCVDFVKS